MKQNRLFYVIPLLTLAASFTSCRAAQMNKLEERVNQLESRTAALEARVDMLTRK